MSRKILTVSQINYYIKSLLEEDILLNEVYLTGEISNFKNHNSGHMYFSLKDPFASINCIMFKSNAQQLGFVPENGMNVTIFGHISVYEKTGQYQLYADFMEKSGKGELYLKFEKLKNKLLDEGLFDEAIKRPIPEYPKCIGIITSPEGAAVQDIINIAKRRNPSVELTVIGTLVQGMNAAVSISKAIEAANRWGEADVLILARGGGSIEDLWAFNEEIVARAINKSKIPIVSAIGHETDYTIADFAADLRAPTPSAAAELTTPDVRALIQATNILCRRLNSAIHAKLSKNIERLKYLTERRVFKRPLENLKNRKIYVNSLLQKIDKEASSRLNEARMMLNAKISLLNNLSPLKVMQRGYAVVSEDNIGLIKSIESISVNQNLCIRLFDGEFKAVVTQKKDGDENGKKETVL